MFSSFHDKTKLIIVNLCRKTLKTVANLTFEHPNIWEELPDPLRRTVSKEFQEYCNNVTDSVLKKSRADDLATFLNKVLVHEVDVWCRGVGVLAEKLGRPVSQNRYPIYDQNLRFSLPYLWPNQKFDTLFMTWPLNQYPVPDLPYNYFPSSDQC